MNTRNMLHLFNTCILALYLHICNARNCSSADKHLPEGGPLWVETGGVTHIHKLLSFYCRDKYCVIQDVHSTRLRNSLTLRDVWM